MVPLSRLKQMPDMSRQKLWCEIRMMCNGCGCTSDRNAEYRVCKQKSESRRGKQSPWPSAASQEVAFDDPEVVA